MNKVLMMVLNILLFIILVPLGMNTEGVLYKLMAFSVIGVTLWHLDYQLSRIKSQTKGLKNE